MKRRIHFISACSLALVMATATQPVEAQDQKEVSLEPTTTTQSDQAPVIVSDQEEAVETSPGVSEVEHAEPIRTTEIIPILSEEASSSEEVSVEDQAKEDLEPVVTTLNQEKAPSKLEEEVGSAADEETVETTTTAEASQESDQEEEKYKVIVQTDNLAAIDRADYRDKESYKLAVSQAETEVQDTINQIRQLLNEQGYDFQEDQAYSGVFTGFSATLNQKAIDQLKAMKQVLGVNLSQHFTPPKDVPSAEPAMNFSGELMGTNLLSEEFRAKYKGDKMIVSVIDTGFDPYHRDFVLAEDVATRYNEASMNEMIQKLGLPGKWYSNKVIYGYNYADNSDVLLSTDEHGNHVAGTIGANGNVKEGGIQGVAPHVQLLLMKAFSEDQVSSSVYEDVWMKAFDDSIKLGADIINMSLGMASGFNMQGNTPMARAMQKARELGVLPVIAAGNHRNATWDRDYHSLKENTDNALGGYPANVEESMSVASIDNVKEMRRYVEAVFGEEGQKEYFKGTQTYPEGESKLLPLVEFGLGNQKDYDDYRDKEGQAVDFTGKLVLVQRGDASFNDKYQLARKHKAGGLIIYDNQESDQTLEMTGLENLDIPIMFVTKKSGERLKEIIANNQNALMRISKDLMGFDLRTAGNLSEFSSWGPATDLTLKPDVAAPGGSIYSLMSDDRYQNMSGTSMATPHMAGAAALIMQRLYEDGILKGTSIEKDHLQDDLAMLFLMNTAVPKLNTLEDGGSYYTPIQQGAGLVNLKRALENFVTVTATNEADPNKDGKLELKEVQDEFKANLELHNYGKKDQTYKLSYVLLKERINEEGRFAEVTELANRQDLGEITVAAGQTISVDHIISTAKIDPNQYVQGYFFLKPIDQEASPLSLPFFGFKGEWDRLPIIDNMVDFDGEDKTNFKPIEYPNNGVDKTAFVRKRLEGGWNYFFEWRVDGDPSVFVNSHEREGFENMVTPKLSFLRNAVDVEFYIENAQKERIRDLLIMNRVYKAGLLYQDQFNFLQDFRGSGWDYTDTFGDQVEEGIYTYVIEGKIDSKDARPQRYEYKIYLDNTDPELAVAKEDDHLEFTATDNLSGIRAFEVYTKEDDKFVSWQEVNREEEPLVKEKIFTLNLKPELKGKALYIWVYDNSDNIKQFELTPEGDLIEVVRDDSGNNEGTSNPEEPANPEDPAEEPQEDKMKPGEKPDGSEEYVPGDQLDSDELPRLKTNSPWYYQGFGKDAEFAELTGEITNYNEVRYIEYRLVDNDGKPITDYEPIGFEEVDGTVRFKANVPLAELQANGLYAIETVAHVKTVTIGERGGRLTKHQIVNRFRLDREDPKIMVDQVFGEDDERLYFEIEYSDNMNYVELFAGNSFIGRIDKTYDGFDPVVVGDKIVYSIPKDKIGKDLTFYVYDDFGNGSEKTVVTVTLQDLVKLEPEVEKRFNPDLALGAVLVAQEGVEGKANVDKDGTILKVLKKPVNEIIEYGPVEVPYEIIRVEGPDLEISQQAVLQAGMAGLKNPLTNEIIKAPVYQIIEMGTKVLPPVEEEPEPEVPAPVFTEAEAPFAGREVEVEDKPEFTEAEAPYAGREVEVEDEPEFTEAEAPFAGREVEVEDEPEFTEAEAPFAGREVEVEEAPVFTEAEAPYAGREVEVEEETPDVEELDVLPGYKVEKVMGADGEFYEVLVPIEDETDETGKILDGIGEGN